MTEKNKSWMGLHDPGLSLDEVHVGIIGVPYDGSVCRKKGAAQAPEKLREIFEGKWPHTDNHINLQSLRLRDFGDVDVDNENDIVTQRAITKMVKPIVDAGVIPIILGGDHSITSGVVSAFGKKEELGILWFDSHPDLMDTFGAVRGVKESKWSHACPLRRISELPYVKPENIMLIGIRDLIKDELQFIRDNNIETLYARDLHHLTPDQLTEKIHQKFEHVPDIYISFDIDVLDPAFAPGTGTPEPGGISTRFLYDILSNLVEKEREYLHKFSKHFLRIAGFDLVEIAPPLDVGEITSLAGRGLITYLLGYIALQEGIPDIDLI